MPDCETCQHSIFCDTWGEWKCKVKSTRITHPEVTNCTTYAKRVGQVPPCNCPDCMRRRISDE